MTETYTELKNKLIIIETTPPWQQAGNGNEGSRAPYPGEWLLWQAEIRTLRGEIAALQLINRP